MNAQVKVYICKEQNGRYSAYTEDTAPINYGLIGEGDTVQEAISEWENMYKEMEKSYREDNMPFVKADFSYAYDIPSFLAYYGKLLTFRGLGKLTGVSAAQLSQYASGYRKPSPKTIEKISRGVSAFGRELSQVGLF